MESHLSGNSIDDQVVRSEDGRDISPSRKHHKTKQKRKVSTVSLRDSDKTNKRTTKRQPSITRTTQEMSAVRESTTTYNPEPVDGDLLSTLEGPQTELEDKDQKATLSLMQMTLDERDSTLNLQRNEAPAAKDDEQTNDGINVAKEAIVQEQPTSSKEAEPINVDLEKKISREDSLDNGGTMDLSSMNIIDSDMSLIIQRVFRRERNKYTQLILRDNALTSDGVKILVDELLKAPTSLKNLTLSSNPGIGDAGIEHLVRLLQTNRSITLLALHHTGITDRGARLLADLLCGTEDNPSSSLEKLYISFNKSITDESQETLIQILEQNQTLKVLSLEHCSLSDRARRRLKQVVAKKKKRKFSLLE